MTPIGAEAHRPNPALEPLTPLVGEWRTTGTHPLVPGTVFQQTAELPLQAIIVGRYRDTFHLVDGRWCFDTREMVVDLTGDLSHHLRFELRA